MTYLDISPNGLLMTERYEGYRSYKYWDPYGHVWTIGFGTTTSVVDPMPNTCTVVQATAWLKDYFDRGVVPYLNAAIAAAPKGSWTPNQNEFDALCDLGYNTGAGVFGPTWQMGRAIRSGDRAAAYAAFMNYVYSGGAELAGLVNRRRAEQALFNVPVPKPSPYAIYPDHYVTYEGITFNQRSLAETLDAALVHPKRRASKATLKRYLPHAVAAERYVDFEARLIYGTLEKPNWDQDRGELEQLWIKRVVEVRKGLRV